MAFLGKCQCQCNFIIQGNIHKKTLWLEVRHRNFHPKEIREFIEPILGDYLQNRKRSTSTRFSVEWFKILPKYQKIFKNIVPF